MTLNTALLRRKTQFPSPPYYMSTTDGDPQVGVPVPHLIQETGGGDPAQSEKAWAVFSDQYGYWDDMDALAVAALWRAAPEMFAELLDIHDFLSTHGYDITRIERVIRRAMDTNPDFQ